MILKEKNKIIIFLYFIMYEDYQRNKIIVNIKINFMNYLIIIKL